MDAKDVINRIKQLQLFEVEVELPDTFEFRGVIPFDMEIADNVARVQVYAVTQAEAQQRAEDYFNG
jgi:hypothetical protein